MQNRWDKDQIALEILRRYSSGQPVSYGEVQKSELRLLRAGARYFGSWKKAVEYAGLDYDEIRRYRVWTAERIVEKIQQYHREGKDLSWRFVSTELDPPLAAAAIRGNRFGTWQAALQAAGLEYDEIRRHRAWDADTVVMELRRLHDHGASLRVTDAEQGSAALVAAARRRFEGWYEAVNAAGLDRMQARDPLLDAEDDEEEVQTETSWAA
jgi:hypothetical protein